MTGVRRQRVEGSIPVVANVMLTVLAAPKDRLKLGRVVEIPPMKVEVGLRVRCGFVSSCQNFKRTDQLQTQCVFQCTYMNVNRDQVVRRHHLKA